MPVSQSWNGSTFTLPLPGDNYGWGAGTTNYLQALGNAALSKAGGAFILTNNVDFGASYGLLVSFLSSRNPNPASTGAIRLANAELIAWRNFANDGNLPLTVNSSNQLTFNGTPLSTASGTVSSVTVAAGSSKLTSTGSPITSSGTITVDVSEANLTLDNIGGTLSVNKGGTGAVTLTGLLRGNGTSAITDAATVSLSSEVSGNLPVTNLNSGTGATSSTFWRGDGTWASPSVVWGGITGTLSNQTDLQNALDAKAGLQDPVFSDSITVERDVITPLGNVVVRSYANSAFFGAYRAEGTIASPTALPVNTSAGIYSFGAYNGTTWSTNIAYMQGYTLENITPSVKGAEIRFFTTEVGTNSAVHTASLRQYATNSSELRLIGSTANRLSIGNTLSFTDLAGTTTYATLNPATGASASTDLLRKSDLSGYLTTNDPAYTGTLTGTGSISISSDSSNLSAVIKRFSSTGSDAPSFIVQKGRGTAASPAAIQNADRIGDIACIGQYGTGTSDVRTGGQIRFHALENWSNTQSGTYMSIQLIPQGTTTPLDVFRLQHNGSGPEIHLSPITKFVGDFSSNTYIPVWQSNTGDKTEVRFKAPGTTSSDRAQVAFFSSSSASDNWQTVVGARNSNSTTGAHRIATLKVTGGVAADSPDPVVFSGGISGTVWATINPATTSSASTDLVRKSELDSINVLTTKGDLLSRSSSAYVREAVGTDGFGLAADSTATSGLKWEPKSKVNLVVTSETGTWTHTVGDNDEVTIFDCSTATSGTITLPATPLNGQIYRFAATGGATGTLTWTPSGTHTVNNAPTSLSAGDGCGFVFSSASSGQWYRIY